jgi:4-amino-4-deoxy-L-arabinose transferase-like glycosyltransferase
VLGAFKPEHLPPAMISFMQKHRFVFLGSVFLLTVLLNAIGVDKVTSPTSKDEYHRVFRTALTMSEENVWFVPLLDGNPRIEKPPFLNWLTRLSFELFGVAVGSARLVILLFSGLLVAVIAAIALELQPDVRYAMSAALIALSTIGMAIHGRILLPDIPTAALSGVAFYFFLKWSRTGSQWFLILAAVVLACSFLTKGPVAFIVFGSGVLALILTDHPRRHFLRRNLSQTVIPVVIFLVLSLSWYVYVFVQFPAYTSEVFEAEYEARRFGRFHLNAILQFTALFFPWTVLLIVSIVPWRSARFSFNNEKTSMLLFWGAISLAPFCFIRSFDRYLVGTLIPASLFCATRFRGLTVGWSRNGVTIFLAFLFVIPVLAFCFWFRVASDALIIAVLILLGIFVYCWWKSVDFRAMAMSSAVLWTAVFGVVFPNLGANEMPAEVIDIVDERKVFFFREPQPAMLPITKGRSMELMFDLDGVAQHCREVPLIFSLREQSAILKTDAASLNLKLRQVYTYKAVLAFEKLIASVLKSSMASNWQSAIGSRSLEPLKTEIALFEIRCGLEGG